jgi:hypothetical protein
MANGNVPKKPALAPPPVGKTPAQLAVEEKIAAEKAQAAQAAAQAAESTLLQKANAFNEKYLSLKSIADRFKNKPETVGQ